MRLRGSGDAVLRTRAEVLRESATAQYPILQAVLANAPSAQVADRAREVEERWKEAIGQPDETQVALGRALAERIRAFVENPVPVASAAEPPTRRTYYRPGASPEVIKQAAA
jgi:hypothetical protein